MVYVEGAEDMIGELVGIDGLFSKDFLYEVFNSSMTMEKLKEMYYNHQDQVRISKNNVFIVNLLIWVWLNKSRFSS